jgi:hypothetical protein
MIAAECKIDRAGWPAGPWDGEPDRLEWRDEVTGLLCLISRGGLGAWCGYVGVPVEHPWCGMGYDAVNGLGVDVHGGLTYARVNAPVDFVAPGAAWWLGFDCGHWQDVTPLRVYSGPTDAYRDVAYVRAEVTKLAAQADAARAARDAESYNAHLAAGAKRDVAEARRDVATLLAGFAATHGFAPRVMLTDVEHGTLELDVPGAEGEDSAWPDAVETALDELEGALRRRAWWMHEGRWYALAGAALVEAAQ